MIDTNYFWLCIALLALGTISIRMSIIAIAGRIRISNRAKEVFTYIPAAILPAFMAPSVFFHPGVVTWAFGKERLFILFGATVLCYFYRSTIATIGFGLAALYLLTRFG